MKPNTPERIYGWQGSQLSIARHYGGISYNGAFYVIAYDEERQPLVRQDVKFLRPKKAKRKIFENSSGQTQAFGFFSAHRRAIKPETKHQKMKNLPSTISEIINCAASMFSDSSVISVNVNASFGEVTVMRDGTVKMA